METVGAYEAKTRFSQLLARVSRGERFVITVHGSRVAILGPAEPEMRRTRSEAIAALREFGRGRSLGDTSVRELIDEGRE